jgi:hypothetical protein
MEEDDVQDGNDGVDIIMMNASFFFQLKLSV